MFQELEAIRRRPQPFTGPGAEALWTDDHVSARMLECHLDPEVDLSSRNHAFIDRSASWIATRFGLGPGRAVLDLGCGPGLYTTRLAATGARVLGVDFSERSIEHARASAARQAVAAEHIRADYLAFETEERFDLVTMIMGDFCVLGPTSRRALLDKIRGLLQPGGAFLFDVYSLHAFDARDESVAWAPNLMDGFWSAAPYHGFHVTLKYEAEKVVLDKYTIVEEARTRVVHNWLQHFAPEALEAELRAVGLEAVELLGDVAGAPHDPAAHEYGVIAHASESPDGGR